MSASFTRRGLAAALPLAALPKLSTAQGAYPTRSVTLVEGFVPGGGSDIVARLLASRLRDDFGQPVVVENKPGASGTIAAAGLVRAEADGYTLMIASPSTLIVVPKARASPPYDSLRDMTPILKVASVPQVVVVPANSRFRALGELLAHARANPDKLNGCVAKFAADREWQRRAPDQAAAWNSPATKVAWARMSRPPTFRTCPFLIIAIAS